MIKRLQKFLTIAMVSLTVAVCGGNLCNSLFLETAYALEDLNSNGEGNEGSSESSGSALGDYLKNQEGLTGEQLNNASQKLAPVTNIIGNIVGGIVVLTFAGVFLITAIDIFYITIPPIRGLLYDGGQSQGVTGGMPMGGGYGYRNGYGQMPMGGAQPQGAISGKKQFISDEAVACVAMMNQSVQPQMQGGMQQQPQPITTKSVIGMYFKKRVFFMILLAICVIILTSSILLGTGVNLAQWLMKLIAGLNNSIPK